ncbi:MAG TPA: hypothetical protein VNN80_10205 [Polyangiaceae bacterium]|jgi:hypothetical protein|nr:hypothetical protein [Polyangiaceae bacterium]
MQNTTGARLALSVAALFAAACDKGDATSSTAQPSPAGAATDKSMPAPPDPKSGNVQCLGINECKGKSACHVIGSHTCAGQNACKGKGWISVPAADCTSKGGKVLDS